MLTSMCPHTYDCVCFQRLCCRSGDINPEELADAVSAYLKEGRQFESLYESEPHSRCRIGTNSQPQALSPPQLVPEALMIQIAKRSAVTSDSEADGKILGDLLPASSAMCTSLPERSVDSSEDTKTPAPRKLLRKLLHKPESKEGSPPETCDHTHVSRLAEESTSTSMRDIATPTSIESGMMHDCTKVSKHEIETGSMRELAVSWLQSEVDHGIKMPHDHLKVSSNKPVNPLRTHSIEDVFAGIAEDHGNVLGSALSSANTKPLEEASKFASMATMIRSTADDIEREVAEEVRPPWNKHLNPCKFWEPPAIQR